MSAISLPEWEQHMDAGATTYTVSSREPVAVYTDRAEAEAAGQAGGTVVQWDGHQGRRLAPGRREAQAEAERELEAGQ